MLSIDCVHRATMPSNLLQGDWPNTDIHEGRIGVAKLTLMRIYEGWIRRDYPDGLIFEVVTKTSAVFCRVRRELENSVLPVGANTM